MENSIQFRVNHVVQAPRHIGVINQTKEKQFRVTLFIAQGRPPYAEWWASNLGTYDKLFDAVNEAKSNTRVIEFSDEII